MAAIMDATLIVCTFVLPIILNILGLDSPAFFSKGAKEEVVIPRPVEKRVPVRLSYRHIQLGVAGFIFFCLLC